MDLWSWRQMTWSTSKWDLPVTCWMPLNKYFLLSDKYHFNKSIFCAHGFVRLVRWRVDQDCRKLAAIELETLDDIFKQFILLDCCAAQTFIWKVKWGLKVDLGCDKCFKHILSQVESNTFELVCCWCLNCLV